MADINELPWNQGMFPSYRSAEVLLNVEFLDSEATLDKARLVILPVQSSMIGLAKRSHPLSRFHYPGILMCMGFKRYRNLNDCTAIRLQHAMQFGNPGAIILHMLQHVVTNDHIERSVAKGKSYEVQLNANGCPGGCRRRRLPLPVSGKVKNSGKRLQKITELALGRHMQEDSLFFYKTVDFKIQSDEAFSV